MNDVITGNEPALSNQARLDEYSRQTLEDLRSNVSMMRQMIPSWSEGGHYDRDPFFQHTKFLLRYAEILEGLCNASVPDRAYWRCYWCGCIGDEMHSGILPINWLIDSHVNLNRYLQSMAFCSTDHRDAMWSLQGWDVVSP